MERDSAETIAPFDLKAGRDREGSLTEPTSSGEGLPLPPVVFVTTGTLLGVARQTYERMSAVPANTDPVSSDALISIVFSAAALEAFANDIGSLASQPIVRIFQSNYPSVTSLIMLHKEADESRATQHFKLPLISSILSGHSFIQEEQSYQDFTLLIRLRNDVIHLNPTQKSYRNEHDKLVTTPPSLVKILQSV